VSFSRVARHYLAGAARANPRPDQDQRNQHHDGDHRYGTTTGYVKRVESERTNQHRDDEPNALEQPRAALALRITRGLIAHR
jgi:hypothetical protein